MLRYLATLPLGALIILATACTDPIQLDGERVSAMAMDDCFDCHGDSANNNAAPPPALWSADSASVRDPHQAHLAAAEWHLAIECETCHTVPDETFSPGHIDSQLPAEVVFSGGASLDASDPMYDAAEMRCNGVYCHGGSLQAGNAGGELTSPAWTEGVDIGPTDCGSCHGSPPPIPHPTAEVSAECGTCHGEVLANGAFVNSALHMDGIVQVDVNCSTCHGTEDNFAPPLDLAGLESTSEPTVGAHQAHLTPSDWHATVPCTACHTVPEAFDDPGHLDGWDGAELTWGDPANSDGAEPFYDAEAAQCSGVYCHGATLSGGNNTAPIWTQVDGTFTVCGSCHSLPPTANDHPPETECVACHAASIDDSFNFPDPSTHINGVVERNP